MPALYRWIIVACVAVFLIFGPACSDEVSTDGENRSVNEGNDDPIGPSCDDGEQSGAQSDIDCGGPNCDPCEAGRNCNFDDDCHSEICDDGICAPHPCEDLECDDGEICYRGACYPECGDDADCEEDSRCYEGHCAPLDCDGVECLESESCYLGGCYPTCAADADCNVDEACLEGSCVDQCELVDCADGESCYRGECYDSCALHDECGDDERCFDNACVPLDCDGVECLDYESCYYGSCYPSCEDETDCGDRSVCEENACVPVCYEGKKSDEEACPELNFETLDPVDVEATSAVLEAEIYELPLSLLSDHGFCWSTEPEPELGSADCESLGVGMASGVYDYRVDDELDPGRYYYVRAFAEHGGEVYYANEVQFLTLAPPVVDVEATQGTIAEYVEVTWAAQPGVVEYEVYRDDTEIGTVAAGEMSYEDDEAEAPEGIDTPADVTATDGDYSDLVHVSWQAAAVDDAEKHQYTVVAVYPDVSAEPSEEAEGYRASSGIEGYQIEIDDSGDWIDVGLALSYDDTAAPAPTVEAGQALASQGTFADRVELEVFDIEGTDGASRSYRVRAVGDGGQGEESDSVTGYRGVGPLAVQWQRSAGETDANYSDISGATTATYDDTGAPADGSPRYYRAVVDADGASPVTTDAVMGFRAALPTVITHPATEITEESAILHGEIANLGAPEPTAHGFCIDTAPAPELGSALLCEDLGSTASTGTFSWLYAWLSPGGEYYVRAYATTNAGTAYGDDITFPTVPTAPIDLKASDGTSDEYVSVTWSPVDGADEYEVYRDGALVDTVSAPEYDDYGAGEGSVPHQPTVTATDGTYTDRVEVSWNEPDVDDGTTHTYHVVAVNDAGDSEPSNSDTGYRAGRDITSYELRIDGGTWNVVGNTTLYEDFDADEPTLDAGAADASEGVYEDYVALELIGAGASPGGEHTYEVRAVNDSGSGDAGEDNGHIGVGPLEIQWQRSADDSDANYSDIGGATTATYQDTDAPADGSGRYYRAVVSAEGAGEAFSVADRGYRAGGTASIEVYLEELGTVDYTVELIGPDGFEEELDGDEYFSAVPAGSYEVVVQDWPVDPYGNASYIDISPVDFELEGGDEQVVEIEVRAAYLVVNEDDSGEGSLRFVIDDVNDGTVVKFWDGVSEIGLNGTQIVVDKQIDIDGGQYTADPVAVDGGGSTRLFRINSGGVVKMTDMVLQNGYGDPGGAARIVDDGQLILGRVTVENNESAQAGGAIAVTDQGLLEVYDTVFANNVANGWGSVIDVPQDEDDVLISIRRSLFQNNVAGGDGGAVDTSGTLEISHSTFVGNESGGRGSAVMVFSGNATLEGLTVVDNVIDSWGGGPSFNDDGAVYVTVHAEATIRGLVAVDNDEADLGGVVENFVSDGYNVIGVMEDENDFEESPTDLLGVDDAELGSLADNGGYTKTMLPGPNSPARAMIPGQECVDDAALSWAYDQRNAYRPAGAFCSAGAAEVDAVVETFDTADMSRSSFNSSVDSFIGVQGIEWEYYQLKRQEEDEGDADAIEGTTIVLNGAEGGWIQAEDVAGGITSVSMLLARADTPGGERSVEVFVDGISVGQSPDVSGETDSFLYVIELDDSVAGDFDLRIESSGDRDVAVDNVSWQ